MTRERLRAALLLACALAWGYLALLGTSRISEIAALHIASQPTASQVFLCFVIPASLTLEAIVALLYRLRHPFARLDLLLIAIPVVLLPLYALIGS